MKNNTIKTDEGIEVYEDKIYYYADQYINNLDNPDDIKKNSSLFAGMIKYIYKHVFKSNKNTVKYNNKNSGLSTLFQTTFLRVCFSNSFGVK